MQNAIISPMGIKANKHTGAYRVGRAPPRKHLVEKELKWEEDG